MSEHKAKFLTVLDFEKGRVYQYRIQEGVHDNIYELEDLLSTLGHSLDTCQWMAHDKEGIHN